MSDSDSANTRDEQEAFRNRTWILANWILNSTTGSYAEWITKTERELSRANARLRAAPDDPIQSKLPASDRDSVPSLTVERDQVALRLDYLRSRKWQKDPTNRDIPVPMPEALLGSEVSAELLVEAIHLALNPREAIHRFLHLGCESLQLPGPTANTNDVIGSSLYLLATRVRAAALASETLGADEPDPRNRPVTPDWEEPINAARRLGRCVLPYLHPVFTIKVEAHPVDVAQLIDGVCQQFATDPTHSEAKTGKDEVPPENVTALPTRRERDRPGKVEKLTSYFAEDRTRLAQRLDDISEAVGIKRATVYDILKDPRDGRLEPYAKAWREQLKLRRSSKEHYKGDKRRGNEDPDQATYFDVKGDSGRD